MKDLNKNEDIQKLANNYDNKELLTIIKYLLQVIINDVEYMNDLKNDMTTAYNFGNNNLIRKDDFESIVSFIDTIENVENDNKWRMELKRNEITKN